MRKREQRDLFSLKLLGFIIPTVLLGPDGNGGGWIQFWRDLGYEPTVTTYSEDLALNIVNSSTHHFQAKS
jgi:hypothetical protein